MNPRYCYYSTLLSFLALFIWLMVWHIYLAPSAHWPVSLTLIVVIGPLLLPWRGLIHGNRRSAIWLCYLSLPYFIHGVVEAYAGEGGAVYPLTEAMLSMIMCALCGLFVYRGR
jgi:uncharacterized membrane protein